MLFIGGPWDGKRVETDSKMDSVFIPDGEDKNGQFKRMEYRRHWLQPKPGLLPYPVYVAEDGDLRDVLSRLIDGYGCGA